MTSDLVADGAGTPVPFATDGTRDDAALASLFELLSDETRLRIVSALAGYAHAHPEAPAIAFAALRQRVGIRDSGRFNYHLRKLDGVLVERTEDGYLLTDVGRRLVAVVSDIPEAPG